MDHVCATKPKYVITELMDSLYFAKIAEQIKFLMEIQEAHVRLVKPAK